MTLEMFNAWQSPPENNLICYLRAEERKDWQGATKCKFQERTILLKLRIVVSSITEVFAVERLKAPTKELVDLNEEVNLWQGLLKHLQFSSTRRIFLFNASFLISEQFSLQDTVNSEGKSSS